MFTSATDRVKHLLIAFVHKPQNYNSKKQSVLRLGNHMSFVFDVPTISVVIASLSVIGGAIYYMLETRHQRKIRQTESVIRLSPWLSMDAKDVQEAIGTVHSAEFTDYKDYIAKYAGTLEERSLKLLGNYFEGIGLLVHRKLVDTDLVFDFWGDVAETVWDEYKEVINGIRKDSGTRWSFEYWEFLVREVKKRNVALSKKKHES